MRSRSARIVTFAWSAFTLSTMVSIVVFAPDEAQARSGARLCYYDTSGYDNGVLYFMRERGNWFNGTGKDCDEEENALYGKAKDVPVLNRQGGNHDMSICENFTKYMMGLDTDKDVCDQMSYYVNYTMEEMQDMMD